MDDEIRRALAIDESSPMPDRTVDITTTGRRSGEPRRLETVFYRHDGVIYLSGLPAARPRAWLLNLAAEPRFTFHLKHGVHADLPAVATVITDPAQRQRILTVFAEQFNRRRDPAGPWPETAAEEWIADSPLARVDFPDPA